MALLKGGALRFRTRAAAAALSTSVSIDSPAKPPGLPMLPVVGSIPWTMSFDVGGGRKVDAMAKQYEALPAMRERYGQLYRMGVPGLGRGLMQELYVCVDPAEYMHVLRNEGSFPFGAAQLQWAIVDFNSKHMPEALPLFSRGQDWRRVRLVMQKDILPPEPALGYLPGVVDAAEAAAEGAPAESNNVARFTGHASLDMFSSVLLGRVCRTANPADANRRQEDVDFAAHMFKAFGVLSPMLQSVLEPLASRAGCPMSMKRQFDGNFALAMAHAHGIADDVLEREKQGRLTLAEEASYLIAAMRRARSTEGADEVATKQIVSSLLAAAVDTTSAVINWALVHLARSPQSQDALYREIEAVLGGGPLTREAMEDGGMPYLHAVLRESHRLTTVAPMVPIKQTDKEMSLCGYPIPAGSMVALDPVSVQNDPALLDEPQAFRPERFLPDAVAARKGTPAELVDHPLLATPFSSGARKCPGSRVAALETRALLVALVRRYRFSSPGLPAAPALPPYEASSTVTPSPIPPFLFEPRA